MRIFKAKLENTSYGEVVQMPSKYGTGFAVKVQSVYYSNTNPNQYLHLYDKDGDEFMLKVPGQGISEKPNPIILETPISIALPLSILDEGGDNEVIVWGEVEKIDNTFDSSF